MISRFKKLYQKLSLSTVLCGLVFGVMNAQDQKTYKVHTIAFYNVENLFDTINDPNKYDEASPMMELKFNRTEIYKKKVKNMASVIAQIGAGFSKYAPAIIGLSEVENRTVVEDLANDSALIKNDYGIVHYDSPDERGIDVALMYRKQFFTPITTSSHELVLYNSKNDKRDYTRDQLLVSGLLEDELIHIIVNHWPSRSGGEAKSRPKRVAAAKLNKYLIDSLQNVDPYRSLL